MLALTAISLAHYVKHSFFAVGMFPFTCLFVVVLDMANKLSVEFNIIFDRRQLWLLKSFFYLYYHKSNDDHAFNMQFA